MAASPGASSLDPKLDPNMNSNTLRSILLGLFALVVGTSCKFNQQVAKGPYNTPAYRAANKRDVSVKVSLSNRMIYVKEGNRTLLTTPTAIGKPESPTPKGNFRTFNRLPRKRSNTCPMC